ncbi:MAG: response regulator [Candidatus Tectomicrobia bacterium]|uniref:histidine kinase n=1 Tax=Tectimicrobiota bacterium TaxID=2528274 RepID=A0A932FWG5_UNCTE|nr:response regulator [Candidatus Tectomicrobia bacterium]
MAISLRVLILEDRPIDAELMVYELREAGFDPLWERVETEADYLARLDPTPDVILADYHLPQFDAPRALSLLQERGLEIPFLIVTNAVGEEQAVECLRRGAADYLRKDRLARLGWAVENALAQTRTRRERERAEEALRRSEERYRNIVENAVEGIFQSTPEGRLLSVNPAMARMYGFASPAEMLAIAPDARRYHVDPNRRSIFQQMLEAQGFVQGFETSCYRKDGRVIWVSVNARIVRDASGVTLYYEGFQEDITARRRAAEENARLLRRTHEEAQTNAALLGLETTLGWARGMHAVCEAVVALVPQLFTGAQACVWLWDPERKQLLPTAMPVESSESQREAFFHPLVPYERQGNFAEVLRTRQLLSVPDAVSDPCVHEVVWRDFGIRSFLLILLLEENCLLGVMCICRGEVSAFSPRDIELAQGTAQRIALALQGERAREDVQQQLTRISLLNHIARAIATRQDLESIFHVTLGQLESHLPIDFSGVLLLDPEANTLTIAARGPKSEPLAARLGTSPGKVVPVEHTAWRACVNGEVVYVPDMAQVDTPILRRIAQAEIRSGVGVPLMVEGRVLGILVACRRKIDGFSGEELKFLQVLGEHVALAAYNARLYGDLQQAYNELRQTQQAVMQQERLRALGQMASGIAHDINNALSPIVGFSDLLLVTEPDFSDRVKRYLQMIHTAGMDIAHIVSRMREFYRRREEQEALFPIDLSSLAKQVIDLTRPRWKDIPQKQGILITVQTELPEGLPFVMGIESEIREALTNLIFNAVDALPGGGTVTLRTQAAALESESQAEGAPTHLFLEVSDTGVGMGEETCQRCLEPFFTTKGEAGTGLGLSMVFGVMQRHEGEIQIESEPGRGTTVRLIFPLRLPGTDWHPAEIEGHSFQGPLRILCIDDEPLLRTLVRDLLENEGHRVEMADGGQVGLDLFHAAQERGEPFEVVITDLGMPQMDGRAVAQAVKRGLPGTPVILLTGWGTQAEGSLPVQVDAVLSKPPKLNDLREALARATRTIPPMP